VTLFFLGPNWRTGPCTDFDA